MRPNARTSQLTDGIAELPTTLVYDCFSGISGDMHIGALVDAGVPGDWLREQLARLPMAEEFELTLEADQRQGIAGTRATVHLRKESHQHRHLRR